jgi:putative addiction module component (TIGR02574 family)
MARWCGPRSSKPVWGARASRAGSIPVHFRQWLVDSERATLAGVTDEASRVLDAAMKLPNAERIELIAILTDSIGDGSSPEEIEAAWLAEAKRRAAAIDRGELDLVDSDEMMARLRARVRRGRERQAATG